MGFFERAILQHHEAQIDRGLGGLRHPLQLALDFRYIDEQKSTSNGNHLEKQVFKIQENHSGTIKKITGCYMYLHV